LISLVVLTISVGAKVGAIDPFDYRSGQALNRLGHEHSPSQDYGSASEQEKKQKYTCPMHPEVVMDHPGNCPKCGMKLVPLKKDKSRPSAKTDNHSMHAMKPGEHEQEGHGEHKMQMSMQSSVNIADPMSRDSSGTSWVPD